MNSFAAKYGVWGLVTGASSGMGTEFARRLAESGLNIVLLARREDRLRSLADELERDYSVKTRVVAVDLTRDDLLDLIREATVDIEIGLLVNNAGFATSGNLLDNDLDAELAMLHVNSRAPLILSHHFGRRMRERGGGGIIFVASTVAYSGSPGWSNYAATKAFELTLSDGIARELKRHGVSVLTVSPGPTQTEFWQVAGGKPLLALTPERVVRTALNNLGRRSTVVVGWINKLIVLSTRFTPRWINAVIFGQVVKLMQAGKPSRETDSRTETSSSVKAA
jgi:short-subunit dehydrogenase